ncbi:MAG TPA: type II toxin-antitoxin system VapB family antitoxin [Telluria sp.]|nr:type II toxin-antitoxin system VapB family antitoxin [Telluria sp.]
MANPAMDKAALFREAIRTFVRVRAAQRLAVLGGAAPTMLDIPRRRAEPSQ